MKEIEVIPSDLITPIVEQLINHVVDFAYGYDLQDEMVESLADFCKDNDIKYNITEVEDI